MPLPVPLITTRPTYPPAVGAEPINHIAPSGPTARSDGMAGSTEYSVICPPVEIRPILWLFGSVNQSAPSSPEIMRCALLFPLGIPYSLIARDACPDKIGHMASKDTAARSKCF